MSPGSLFGGIDDALREALDRVTSEARTNEEFRQALLRSPNETLERFGLDKRLARGVASEIGLFGGKCDDTCINNTGADCKYDTCRLTDPCGWTVCDTTNKATHLPEDPWSELRLQIDQILERVAADPGLKSELLTSPQVTLERLGVGGWAVTRVMLELGLAAGKCDPERPSCINNTGSDCKDDTCRLTDPCGWTVCGPKTNYMPGGIASRPLDVTNRTLGQISAAEFLQALDRLGGAGRIAVWPEKKKRELWAEPEGFADLLTADVLRVVSAEKKKLELETQPERGAGSAREALLDQLAEEVSARLRRRP